MANFIDLDIFQIRSFYSDFETPSLNVLELVESFSGPVPISPVNIEHSIINEKWPRFNTNSDVNFTVNSPLFPSILSSVKVKPMGVIKLFCDHTNLTWEHVKIIAWGACKNYRFRSRNQYYQRSPV